MRLRHVAAYVAASAATWRDVAGQGTPPPGPSPGAPFAFGRPEHRLGQAQTPTSAKRHRAAADAGGRDNLDLPAHARPMRGAPDQDGSPAIQGPAARPGYRGSLGRRCGVGCTWRGAAWQSRRGPAPQWCPWPSRPGPRLGQAQAQPSRPRPPPAPRRIGPLTTAQAQPRIIRISLVRAQGHPRHAQPSWQTPPAIRQNRGRELSGFFMVSRRRLDRGPRPAARAVDDRRHGLEVALCLDRFVTSPGPALRGHPDPLCRPGRTRFAGPAGSGSSS